MKDNADEALVEFVRHSVLLCQHEQLTRTCLTHLQVLGFGFAGD